MLKRPTGARLSLLVFGRLQGGMLALGDVLRRAGHVDEFILNVKRLAVTLHKTDRSVRPDDAKLEFDGLFSGCAASQPCLHPRPIVRMYQAEQRLDGWEERVR